MQEFSLQRFTAVDVYRALDVPTMEFVVKAAVDDDSVMILRLEKLCQSGSLDRVAARIECLIVAN